MVALLLLPSCGDLLTSDDESGRRNWGVVIGISSYENAAFNLRWAEEDALDVYDTLRRSKGWEADKITLLTGAAATRDNIRAALMGLAKRVSADDQVLFYFAGRGTFGPDQPPFDEGDGIDEYLVPFDALGSSPAHDLGDDELETLFAALPTNNVVIVLDTAFGGPGATLGGGGDRSLVRGGRRPVPRGIDGMNRDLARPGYVLLAAAQPGAGAFESSQLRNGVFTYHLVEGLRGAANPGRKSVTVQQAFEYAAPRTTAYAAGQLPQAIDNRGKPLRLVTY